MGRRLVHVDLHPIAGGQDKTFRRTRSNGNRIEFIRHVRGGNCQSPEDLGPGSSMTDADAQDHRSSLLRYGVRRSPASRTAPNTHRGVEDDARYTPPEGIQAVSYTHLT